MTVPTSGLTLMYKIYKDILPAVHEELAYWKKRAENIPNDELRKQALASINSKTFHCEGGGILALLAEEHYRDAIKFIVAYQTISDYLDNLCDRSTSQDPNDFEALHEAMLHSIQPDHDLANYYRYREDDDDNGYLKDLVLTCQRVLQDVPNFTEMDHYLYTLSRIYCDLQVHKHVTPEEREERLIRWFEEKQEDLPAMSWYEFSASAGSTLGIFCLVSYAYGKRVEDATFEKLYNGYFPYLQGVHILLDYLIDEEEDIQGGDLNFCMYYPSEVKMKKRFGYFVHQGFEYLQGVPYRRFHRLILQGLLGVYLADSKMQKKKRIVKDLLRQGGLYARFFYWNARVYNVLQKR
ncbi:MAG: tetraprenyl-beta-curcumene synthase family protein [Bacillaceae bacterium]